MDKKRIRQLSFLVIILLLLVFLFPWHIWSTLQLIGIPIAQALLGRPLAENVSGLNVQQKKLAFEIAREMNIRDAKKVQWEATYLKWKAIWGGIRYSSLVRENPTVAYAIAALARGKISRAKALQILSKAIGMDRARMIVDDITIDPAKADYVVRLAEYSLAAKTEAAFAPAARAAIHGILLRGGVPVTEEEIASAGLGTLKEWLREALHRLPTQYRQTVQRMLEARSKEELLALGTEILIRW